MKRRDYSWRFAKSAANGLVRDARRDELLEELSAAGPQMVYAGLLAYAIGRGSQKAGGYAAHLFKEIFGTWPRASDRRDAPQPLPNSLIEEWAASRKKPRHIKAEKPAPLLDRFPERPRPVDANGFVEGTLMRPEDFEVKW